MPSALKKEFKDVFKREKRGLKISGFEITDETLLMSLISMIPATTNLPRAHTFLNGPKGREFSVDRR